MSDVRRRAWILAAALAALARTARADPPAPPPEGGDAPASADVAPPEPAVPSTPGPVAPSTVDVPSHEPAVPTPYVTGRTCCPKGRLLGYVERKEPADLSGDRGTIESVLGRAEFEVAMPVARSLTWEVVGAAEHDVYRLSRPDAVVAGSGRLLEDATLLSLTTRLETPISRALAFRAGVNAASTGVPGADFASTLTWGGEGSFRISVGGDAWVRVGVSYHTLLEQDGFWWPVLGAGGGGEGGPGWEIEARWNLVGVSREVRPGLRLGGAARYDRKDWRLADSDRVERGVVRDIRGSVGALATWVISDSARLSVAAWYDFAHDLYVEDRHGDRVTDLPASPSLAFSVWLSWRF